jgi:hypothetical protein
MRLLPAKQADARSNDPLKHNNYIGLPHIRSNLGHAHTCEGATVVKPFHTPCRTYEDLRMCIIKCHHRPIGPRTGRSAISFNPVLGTHWTIKCRHAAHCAIVEYCHFRKCGSPFKSHTRHS